MPVKTDWFIEKRVIITHYKGNITQADILATSEEVETFFAEGIAPVHWLIDVTNLEKPYIELGTLRRTLEFVKQPSFGWGLVFGGNRLLNFLATTIGQLLGVRYRLMSNLDEAIQFLREHDDTLVDIEIREN